MVDLVSAFFVADVISSLLTVVVALQFLRIYRHTRHPVHLLFAIGFGLVGVSYLSFHPSSLIVEPPPDFTALRIAGQLGGILVLFFSYLSLYRRKQPGLGIVPAWAIVISALMVAALYFLGPPVFDAPIPRYLTWAHLLMVIFYGSCGAMALHGFRRNPQVERLFVPMSFLAWGIGKYTWLMVDLTGSEILVPFAYMWRFIAIILLLLASSLPIRRMPTRGMRTTPAATPFHQRPPQPPTTREPVLSPPPASDETPEPHEKTEPEVPRAAA